MTTFTNLNKETIRKASKRFQSYLETVIEANGDFFEEIWSLVLQCIFM